MGQTISRNNSNDNSPARNNPKPGKNTNRRRSTDFNRDADGNLINREPYDDALEQRGRGRNSGNYNIAKKNNNSKNDITPRYKPADDSSQSRSDKSRDGRKNKVSNAKKNAFGNSSP